MAGPIKNLISDTLYDAEGIPVNGTITVSNPTTFTSSDGFVILQGYTQVIQIVNGVLNVSLVISPTGQQYLATYQVTDQAFQENWVVPASPSPCTLAEVIVF